MDDGPDGKRYIVMLKHGILGLLNYHDMTGYEIMEVFRDSLQFFWNAQTSQIYRELQGLEQKGWVTRTVVPQMGKPDKNVYSVNESGREELLKWLADDRLNISAKVPVLMKVFFMGERDKEENLAYFKRLKKECEEFQKRLGDAPHYIDEYSRFAGDKEKPLYWQMTVDFGYRSMQTYIDWAQSCIEKLEGM